MKTLLGKRYAVSLDEARSLAQFHARKEQAIRLLLQRAETAESEERAADYYIDADAFETRGE